MRFNAHSVAQCKQRYKFSAMMSHTKVYIGSDETVDMHSAIREYHVYHLQYQLPKVMGIINIITINYHMRYYL